MKGERDAIATEDVDDVIGIALENQQEDASRIAVDDVEDIAQQLDIPGQYVREAVDELADRKEAERREQEAARNKRQRAIARLRKAALLLVLGVAAVAMLGAVATTQTQSSLAPKWAEVQRRRSQVTSVLERQRNVQARVANRPDDIQRQDALAGAENRVAIERRRYDQAAATYNASASGFPQRVLCRFVDVPCHAPLADEVREW